MSEGRKEFTTFPKQTIYSIIRSRFSSHTSPEAKSIMAGLINTIQTKLGELSTGGTSKKALLLGAGFVCKPTAQILADAGIEVTIGMWFNVTSNIPSLSSKEELLTSSSLQDFKIGAKTFRRPTEHPPNLSRCH
jgi:hypothetical protein